MGAQSPLFWRLAPIITMDFAIQMAIALPALFLQTEKFYDLSGASTTVLLTLLTLRNRENVSERQRWTSAIVAMWGVRLSLFLFRRILKSGSDWRFNKVKRKPLTFLLYWMIQALWIFLDGLPVFILNSREDTAETTWIDYAGRFIGILGFIMETLADHQKSVFKSDPANHGKFISSGLWRYCQHPNYFGEFLVWIGIWLSSVSAFKGMEHIGVLSPIFTILLITKVSGIPFLQRRAKKTWGEDPVWQKYHKTTPLIIPSLAKLFSKKEA